MSTAPGSERPDDSAHRAGQWRALTVCLIGGFMVLLDVSIVNVALPSINSSLGAGHSELQWVVSGYSLAFGLLLVPAGRIGDIFGRRSVFVLGLALFAVSSAACGTAPNGIALLVGRIVQGLAGGILTPQITAVIQETFSDEQRPKAFGRYGAVVGISTAVGPLIGGLLIAVFGAHNGWRAVFLVNVPVGLIAIPLAWRWLPRRNPDRGGVRHDIDPVGVLLLSGGAVLLLLPLVQDREWPPTTWLLVPLALIVLGCFVAWDRHYARRGREPLVDLDLFRLRSYSFGLSLITLYFAGYTPMFFILTLYLQTGQHDSALVAGLAVTPFSVGSALAAGLSGRLVNRLGRSLIAVGLVLVGLGFSATLLAVHLEPVGGTAWAALVPLLVAGVGGGLIISPNQSLTLSQVPVEQAGSAGGLLQTSQRLGGAIGIAAVGAVFFARIAGTSDVDYASAFQWALLVAVGFVAAALVITVADRLVDREISTS